jgi:hypothetical protein
MTIDTVKIFPPIGIARLGNSPNEFFIGPEIPGDHTPPAWYKDSADQAASSLVSGFRLKLGFSSRKSLWPC